MATYDSQTRDAKIYVNGSKSASSKGSGLLSQDWGGRVGIGRHKDTRDLLGDVDEFRIYNEAIQGEKIMELSRECDFDKYCKFGLKIHCDYIVIKQNDVSL